MSGGSVRPAPVCRTGGDGCGRTFFPAGRIRRIAAVLACGRFRSSGRQRGSGFFFLRFVGRLFRSGSGTTAVRHRGLRSRKKPADREKSPAGFSGRMKERSGRKPVSCGNAVSGWFLAFFLLPARLQGTLAHCIDRPATFSGLQRFPALWRRAARFPSLAVAVRTGGARFPAGLPA